MSYYDLAFDFNDAEFYSTPKVLRRLADLLEKNSKVEIRCIEFSSESFTGTLNNDSEMLLADAEEEY